MTDPDLAFMQRALELAARGLGRTSPNPAVGAVVVREGRVVGEGWHHAAGQPHAEVEALHAAGDAARGATVYVTLEPCSHHGRTPPCTEALLAAGVSRVVWACADCDPRSAARAARLLQAGGIETACGPLGEEARRLNEAFFQYNRTGMPFVMLKLALTLDGRCATRANRSQWITGPASRRRVHQLRDRVDAVMIGRGTLLADDPELTVRLLEPPDGRQPLRVVLAAGGAPPDPALFAAPGQTLLVVAEDLPGDPPAERVEYLRLPAPGGFFDLSEVLRRLGQRGVMSVLVEGGPTLAGQLLAQGLADKLVFFYAPLLLLDEQARGPAVPGRAAVEMAQALRYEICEVEQLGPDVMVTLYPCSQD